jgi:hypothetical protein
MHFANCATFIRNHFVPHTMPVARIFHMMPVLAFYALPETRPSAKLITMVALPLVQNVSWGLTPAFVRNDIVMFRRGATQLLLSHSFANLSIIRTTRPVFLTHCVALATILWGVADASVPLACLVCFAGRRIVWTTTVVLLTCGVALAVVRRFVANATIQFAAVERWWGWGQQRRGWGKSFCKNLLLPHLDRSNTIFLVRLFMIMSFLQHGDLQRSYLIATAAVLYAICRNGNREDGSNT